MFNKIKIPYRIKKFFKLHKVKSLLEDEYSKDVFDEMVHFINNYKLLCDKYEKYHHPIVKMDKGDVVIDVGVSIDTKSTRRMLETVGNEGFVIGFEPNIYAIDLIEKDLSEYSNFKLYPYGLWNKEETKKLYLNAVDIKSEYPSASLTDNYMDSDYSVDANLVKLDDFLKTINCEKIDFIKITAEGSELEVLEGSVETIKNFKPNMVIDLYWHPQVSIYSIILYLDSLKLGYKFWFGQHTPYCEDWKNVYLYASARF